MNTVRTPEQFVTGIDSQVTDPSDLREGMEIALQTIDHRPLVERARGAAAALLLGRGAISGPGRIEAARQAMTALDPLSVRTAWVGRIRTVMDYGVMLEPVFDADNEAADSHTTRPPAYVAHTNLGLTAIAAEPGLHPLAAPVDGIGEWKAVATTVVYDPNLQPR